MGAVIATGLYACLKYVGYWRITPNADSTNVEHSAMNDLHLDNEGNSTGAGARGAQVGSTATRTQPHAGAYNNNHSGVNANTNGTGVNHGMPISNNGAGAGVGAGYPRTSDATFTNDVRNHAVMGEKISNRSPV